LDSKEVAQALVITLCVIGVHLCVLCGFKIMITAEMRKDFAKFAKGLSIKGYLLLYFFFHCHFWWMKRHNNYLLSQENKSQSQWGVKRLKSFSNKCFGFR
jgi:hypothetical protein